MVAGHCEACMAGYTLRHGGQYRDNSKVGTHCGEGSMIEHHRESDMLSELSEKQCMAVGHLDTGVFWYGNVFVCHMERVCIRALTLISID